MTIRTGEGKSLARVIDGPAAAAHRGRTRRPAVWAERRTIVRMTDDPTRTWTVDDHLRDADPVHVELWRRVVELVEACGPVTVLAHRTTVAFAVGAGAHLR